MTDAAAESSFSRPPRFFAVSCSSPWICVRSARAADSDSSASASLAERLSASDRPSSSFRRSNLLASVCFRFSRLDTSAAEELTAADSSRMEARTESSSFSFSASCRCTSSMAASFSSASLRAAASPSATSSADFLISSRLDCSRCSLSSAAAFSPSMRTRSLSRTEERSLFSSSRLSIKWISSAMRASFARSSSRDASACAFFSRRPRSCASRSARAPRSCSRMRSSSSISVRTAAVLLSADSMFFRMILISTSLYLSRIWRYSVAFSDSFFRLPMRPSISDTMSLTRARF